MQLALIRAAILVSATIGLASAQDYPNRAIRVIVPTAPGGSVDILARVIGEKLHERWRQPFIVEARPGAGQMIGTHQVARSPADGYTLTLVTVTYTTSIATQPKLPFDPVKDLTGITMVAEGPFVLVVHPSLPVRNFKDLIALARNRPGELNYGSAGSGTILHFATEVLAASANINIVHVPYKSMPTAVTDTVGGHIQILVGSLPNVWPQVRTNRVRALGVTSAKRSRFVPDLPTLAEAGVPGYEAKQWWGMLAPAKTPKEIIAKIYGEMQEILATEDIKSRLAPEGAEPVLGLKPEDFNAILEAEIGKWKKLARERNITS